MDHTLQKLPDFLIWVFLSKRELQVLNHPSFSLILYWGPWPLPHVSPTARTSVITMTVSVISWSGLVTASLLSSYGICKARTSYQQTGACEKFILKSVTLDKKTEHIYCWTKDNNLKLLMLSMLDE